MITTVDKLSEIRSDPQNSGKTIVLTGGTFDVLHSGHVRYLEAVKALGDIVVVMLSGDHRVAHNKPNKEVPRPIIPEEDRAIVIDNQKQVDYVFIDNRWVDDGKADLPYIGILDSLRPDVYATDGPDPRFSNLTDLENEWQTRTVIIELDREAAGKFSSTSGIIEQIILSAKTVES